jgi:hypothetical protein
VIPQVGPTSAYLVRLREGTPLSVAERRITETVRRLAPAPPNDWTGVHMIGVQDMYVSQIRPILVAVTAAAALILLIIAANVAVLVVLRALRRERDVAVRVALGARPRDIARMLGAEAAIVCAGAVVLGVASSAVALGALGPIIERRLGRPVPGGVATLGVDNTVLLVVAAAAFAAVLLLAFAPMAIPLARRLERSLRSGARAGSDGPGVKRARFALVALQVAASLALLFGAGLIVRSVRALMSTSFGYDTTELVRVRIRFPNRQFPDSASMVRYQVALEEAVRGRMGAPIAFSTNFQFWEQSKQRVETGPVTPGARSRATGDSRRGPHGWLAVLRGRRHDVACRARLRRSRRAGGRAGGHRQRDAGAPSLAAERRDRKTDPHRRRQQFRHTADRLAHRGRRRVRRARDPPRHRLQ